MNPLSPSATRQLWFNARLATFDPSLATPYGHCDAHALVIEHGHISARLPMHAVDPQHFDGLCHDAGGRWITPAFVDCHTHLIYGGNRAREWAQRLHGVSYAEIARQGGGILSTVRATRALDVAGLVTAARPRLEALLAEGVMCVEIKSGYGLDLASELTMLRAAQVLAQDYPVDIQRTLLAAHALPVEYQGRANDYIDWVVSTLIPSVATQQLASAVDVFCEHLAFNPTQCARVFDAALAHGLAIKGHVEQLSNQHGAALVARYHGLSADHLEYLDEPGVRVMAAAGTVAVLLPGAFYFLGETQRPPIAALRTHGVPIAVATDLNPGTSPFASLRLALNQACVLFGLTPEEALAGATRVAAQALGLGTVRGQLAPGFCADFLLWDIDDPAELVYAPCGPPPTVKIRHGALCDA